MLAKTREHRNPVRGRLLDTGGYKLQKYLFTQLSFHFFLLFSFFSSFVTIALTCVSFLFFTSMSILYNLFLFLGIIIIDGAVGIMN